MAQCRDGGAGRGRRKEALLTVQSAFSLLWGTDTPERLAGQAARLGYAAVGLADRASLAGSVRFCDAAARAGVKALVGAEIPCMIPREGRKTPAGGGGARQIPDLLLLAKDRGGFGELCRILTRLHLEDRAPSDPRDLLARYAGSLWILADRVDAAEKLREAIGPRSLRLGVRRPGASVTAERDLVRFSRRSGIPLVAAPACIAVDPGRHAIHRLLRAIAERILMPRVRPPICSPPGSHLPSPEELRARYRDLPEALEEARRIADASEPVLPPQGEPIFPSFPLPEGETPYGRLYALAAGGLRAHVGSLDARHVLRLTRELEVIDRLGFTTYFLVVDKIVRLARARGIAIRARGSAGGSLVAFALGIADVDPLAFGLSFERFLNARRTDRPDIDLDVAWDRRDELIEAIFQHFPPDRVAMIATYPTFQARSAFREAARALGVEPEVVDRYGARIPDGFGRSLREAIEASPRARAIPWRREPFRTILPLAEGLIGIPRHLSVHPGGIAIADRPLPGIVPLVRAPKGVVVTQLDMRGAGRRGLVKIDLLGSRALAERSEAMEWIRRREGVRIDPSAIPDGDEATGDLLRAGRTIGVFQLESPAMRSLLRHLRVRTVREAIAAIALVRPGPTWAGTKEAFLRRAKGQEVEACGLPEVRRALAASCGMIIFEEDVMAVASAVAGLDGEEADELRRALKSSGDPARRRALEDAFLRRAIERGIPAGAARRVWEDLLRLAGYTYNKAHATAYGHLAFGLAYLKAHHPQGFFAAVLNHHAGLYPRRVLVEEAKRCGVRILPPAVARSDLAFLPEGDGLRIPLTAVKGLRAASIQAILEGRPFAGLEDLIRRTRIGRREIERLILCGALDETGEPRPRLLWALHATHPRARGAEANAPGPPPLASRPAYPPIPDFPPARKAAHEIRILGFPVGPHPMVHLRERARALGCIPVAEIAAHAGRRVACAGLVAACKETETPRSRGLIFLTIEDESGLAEAVLRGRAYRCHAARLRHIGPFRLEGIVEERFGQACLVLESIEPFEAGRSDPRHAAGRDPGGGALNTGRGSRPASRGAPRRRRTRGSRGRRCP